MELLVSPLFLMSLAILVGTYFGNITIRQFKLGVSGILFIAMGLGWWVQYTIVQPQIALGGEVPRFVTRILQEGLVGRTYFDFLLLLFVASVGLSAAKDVAKVFRGNGIKFLVMAIVITLTGAVVVYLLFSAIDGLDKLTVAGVYTGALTSSPGLGIALEIAGKLTGPLAPPGTDAAASVGLGYAASYPFSVITVILAMQFIPRLFQIDLEAEIARLDGELGFVAQYGVEEQVSWFDVPGFMMVSISGMLLGKVALPLGAAGRISLETTGGVLVAALVLGNIGRLGPFNFRMNKQALGMITQIALIYFLAYVGLNYGYQAVTAMAGPNALLVLVGVVTTLTAILVGFLVGRYLLKMNWVLLSGAICGGMTSTPGLGAAMDKTGRSEVAGSYGSTYPLGLLCKVIIVLMLYRLPL